MGEHACFFTVGDEFCEEALTATEVEAKLDKHIRVKIFKRRVDKT